MNSGVCLRPRRFCTWQNVLSFSFGKAMCCSLCLSQYGVFNYFLSVWLPSCGWSTISPHWQMRWNAYFYFYEMTIERSNHRLSLHVHIESNTTRLERLRYNQWIAWVLISCWTSTIPPSLIKQKTGGTSTHRSAQARFNTKYTLSLFQFWLFHVDKCWNCHLHCGRR